MMLIQELVMVELIFIYDLVLLYSLTDRLWRDSIPCGLFL